MLCNKVSSHSVVKHIGRVVIIIHFSTFSTASVLSEKKKCFQYKIICYGNKALASICVDQNICYEYKFWCYCNLFVYMCCDNNLFC